jgi:hypothetical protein
MPTEFTGSTLLTRLLADRSIPDLRTLRAQLKAELEAARGHVSRLESDLADLEQVIADRTGRTAERQMRNGRPARTSGPSLRESIIAVMSEHPGPWSTQDVYDTLVERGVAPDGQKPKNSIGSRLLEMTKRGEARRVDRGRFALTKLGTDVQQELDEEEVPAI